MRDRYGWMAMLGGLLAISVIPGCLDTVPDASVIDDPRFPKQPHLLYPTVWGDSGQVATGVISGEAMEQPITFPHYTHVAVLQINCEYCHSEARKSIHAGVPPVQTCMNCHSQVQRVKDRPQILKLKEYCGEWDARAKRCVGGSPIPWAKVHDLPDYVRFNHKRHVRAGVQCTECHGNVGYMGRKVALPDGDYAIDNIMIRETKLQMGWCLNCHASHPSIDENYGDMADLRRAELKDCWTCHK